MKILQTCRTCILKHAPSRKSLAILPEILQKYVKPARYAQENARIPSF